MIVKEEDKRAIEIWKKQYPDQHFLNISRRTAIEVGEIGTVNIGNKIVVFRGIYKAMQEGRKYNDYNNFSPEEITYLNSQGMIWDYETWKEEVYRKAVEIWKQDHQDQQFLNIPRNTIIEVEGVGNVVIGKKIHTLRCIYQAMRKGGHYGQNKDLTNVEIDYWDSQGMIWDYDKWKEEVYRKAVEIWKKDHLDQQFLNMSKRTIIEVPG
ncbi:MAG: hypothetical protein PUB18_03325, partial [bacterium]|nr:hypothetical protein [bacterium]